MHVAVYQHHVSRDQSPSESHYVHRQLSKPIEIKPITISKPIKLPRPTDNQTTWWMTRLTFGGEFCGKIGEDKSPASTWLYPKVRGISLSQSAVRCLRKKRLAVVLAHAQEEVDLRMACCLYIPWLFFLGVSVTNESPAVIDTTPSMCFKCVSLSYLCGWLIRPKKPLYQSSHMNTN